MERKQIEETMRIVTDALIDLETAKQDCKLKIESAFETYDFTPNQEKALLQVAKAKLKEGKLEDLEAASRNIQLCKMRPQPFRKRVARGQDRIVDVHSRP